MLGGPVIALMAGALAPGPSGDVEIAAAHDGLGVTSPTVDEAALVRSLDARMGSRWRAWSIAVEAGTEPGAVQVTLEDPEGNERSRSLSLAATTPEERSRELASALALLMDEPPPPPRDEPPPPTAEVTRPSGWLGVGPRLGLNASSSPDIDVGASLAGGAWLVKEHLQPWVMLDWSRSGADSLVVDAIRMGGGVLGGAALTKEQRLWLGAGLLVRAQWAQAREAQRVSGWWASGAAVMSLQVRGRVVVAGLSAGADLLLPPLRARGGPHTVRWAAIRPMVSIHVGFRLPPRR